MAITRWMYGTPWLELDQVARRLSNGHAAARAEGWLPPVSVEETPQEIVLTAELPGMKPEDVELTLENSVLTLRGEKREQRSEEEESRRYHLWERSYGRFTRAFTLPRAVRSDEVSAHFENGLLRIRVPKAAEAISRKIQIEGGQVPASDAGESQLR